MPRCKKVFPSFLGLAAFERQDILLDRELDFIRLETGQRDRYLEAVLVEPFDVVGGIALLPHPLGGFGEVEQTVDRNRAKNLCFSAGSRPDRPSPQFNEINGLEGSR